MNKDFSVEPFRSRAKFRSDKGLKHNYPVGRRCWNPICLETPEHPNLSINQASAKEMSMDTKTERQFKHSPEVREFMRLAKQKQRANKKKGDDNA